MTAGLDRRGDRRQVLGAMLTARLTGFGWRASAVIGTLMNTRGLTELIVLNIALEKGVISEALFASLVIMALVTTFMAGPILRLLDPRNEFGAPLERRARRGAPRIGDRVPRLSSPRRSILLAPQSEAGLAQLLPWPSPLRARTPQRELILPAWCRRRVVPQRASGAACRPRTGCFAKRRARSRRRATSWSRVGLPLAPSPSSPRIRVPISAI